MLKVQRGAEGFEPKGASGLERLLSHLEGLRSEDASDGVAA